MIFNHWAQSVLLEHFEYTWPIENLSNSMYIAYLNKAKTNHVRIKDYEAVRYTDVTYTFAKVSDGVQYHQDGCKCGIEH
jgi:hypothetical protein